MVVTGAVVLVVNTLIVMHQDVNVVSLIWPAEMMATTTTTTTPMTTTMTTTTHWRMTKVGLSVCLIDWSWLDFSYEFLDTDLKIQSHLHLRGLNEWIHQSNRMPIDRSIDRLTRILYHVYDQKVCKLKLCATVLVRKCIQSLFGRMANLWTFSYLTISLWTATE